MAEEIADSWEDLENNEDLEKKFVRVATPETNNKDNAKNIVVPKLQEETTGRTAYTPTVRILKRETNNTQNNGSPAERLAAKPIRTLEEREAAYAEARLRILGSACHPEDEEEKNSESGSSNNTEVPSGIKLSNSSTKLDTAVSSASSESNKTVSDNR